MLGVTAKNWGLFADVQGFLQAGSQIRSGDPIARTSLHSYRLHGYYQHRAKEFILKFSPGIFWWNTASRVNFLSNDFNQYISGNFPVGFDFKFTLSPQNVRKGAIKWKFENFIRMRESFFMTTQINFQLPLQKGLYPNVGLSFANAFLIYHNNNYENNEIFKFKTIDRFQDSIFIGGSWQWAKNGSVKLDMQLLYFGVPLAKPGDILITGDKKLILSFEYLWDIGPLGSS